MWHIDTDGPSWRYPKTKYYAGNLYEKEITENDTREINYIFANGKVVAVYENSEMEGESTLYMHHDHLGSVMAYSNESKELIEELSYDAWGRRRNPNTWSYYDFSNDGISVYDHGFTGHEHIDRFDMINMDGRMYDPVVGRFMSPDPYMQAPDFTQSLNRYAYCINNPLSLTDPSGYNWIESTFSAIVGIAVGIETGGLASGVYGAIVGGALGGASASLMSSVLNGANLWQTAKSTFTGAFWGAASGTVNFEIGNIENVFSRIAAHTAAEGAMEGIRGGHVEHGLLMGLTSSTGGALINKYGTNLTYAERVAVNATLGGVVSEIGGGKFASGAMTAAYSMMFNDLKHELLRRNKLFMCYERYKNKHSDWRYRVRRDAFRFMINRSKYTGNEVAAAVLENGYVLVFRDEGNTYTGSNNYYADTPTGTFVNINGTLEAVKYQVHTHPICNGGVENPLRISDNDIKMASRFNNEIHIIDVNTENYYSVFSNQLYGIQQIKWK